MFPQPLTAGPLAQTWVSCSHLHSLEQTPSRGGCMKWAWPQRRGERSESHVRLGSQPWPVTTQLRF